MNAILALAGTSWRFLQLERHLVGASMTLWPLLMPFKKLWSLQILSMLQFSEPQLPLCNCRELNQAVALLAQESWPRSPGQCFVCSSWCDGVTALCDLVLGGSLCPNTLLLQVGPSLMEDEIAIMSGPL